VNHGKNRSAFAVSLPIVTATGYVNVCHCRDCQRRSACWTSHPIFQKKTVRLDGPISLHPHQRRGDPDQPSFFRTAVVAVLLTREIGSIRFGIPVGTLRSLISRAVHVVLGEKALRIVTSGQRRRALEHQTATALMHRHRERITTEVSAMSAFGIFGMRDVQLSPLCAPKRTWTNGQGDLLLHARAQMKLGAGPDTNPAFHLHGNFKPSPDGIAHTLQAPTKATAPTM